MTSLSIDDVKDLKTYLKNVEKQLKKFSIDKDSLEKYAIEEMKRKEELEKEKEKKEWLKMKSKYKPREIHVEELLEEVFEKINDVFEGDEDYVWGYNLCNYLKDEHLGQVEIWRKKLEQFQKELKDEMIEIIKYIAVNHPQIASEE